MKKWLCKVCGYVHDGPTPPETCPVCGAPASEFEEIIEEKAPAAAAPTAAAPTAAVPAAAAPAESAAPRGSANPVAPLAPSGDDVKNALFTISYGMFVVTTRKGEVINGQTCNTLFQVTSDPARIAFALNHNNYTHDLVKDSGVLTVNVLGRGNMGLVKQFGFKSGRNTNKFEGIEYSPAPKTGCPILSGSVGYLECRLVEGQALDVGTHTLFVADVVGGKRLTEVAPMTYSDYRRNRSKADADDLDLQDVVAALNLEYGANRRYRAQMEDLPFPALVKVLEGVARTEGDHIDDALAYLLDRLPGDSGMARALLYMKMNLDFEEVARDTYLAFSKEVRDEGLRKMFQAQARAEMGHVNIFKGLIRAMESGEFPVVVYCPVCGWDVDFGTSPESGAKATCERCGVNLRLSIKEGGWSADVVS